MTFGGVCRGIVTGMGDPSGKGRVMVHVPGAGSAWAPVCIPFGAQGGDIAPGGTVVVAFEGGDPARPIVLGRLA